MFKIDNAIILAAGRGTRMGDLCDNTPKPLLKINNEPMIESIIKRLIKIGIKNINIVTGYCAEQFNYLRGKYNVNIFLNNNWDKGNNVTSINAVINKLSNSIIINGDVIINSDCIELEYENPCTYAEYNTCIHEWFLELDKQGNIHSINKNPINATGLFQREITVINNELAYSIKKEIDKFDISEYYEILVLECAKKYNIPFKPFIIEKESVFDLDNKNSYLEYINNKK